MTTAFQSGSFQTNAFQIDAGGVTNVTLTVSSSSSATVAQIKSLLKAITASATSTATIAKGYLLSKLLSITSTSTSTIARKLTIAKFLSVVSSSTVSLAKALAKTISASSTSTASFVRARLVYLYVTISYIGNNFVSGLQGAIDGIGINSFAINAINTAQYYSVSLATHIIRSKILNVTVSSLATFIRAISKIMLAVNITIVRINKAISITIGAISATIVTIIRDFFPKLGAVVRYTFIANMRDDLIQLFKQRNVRANESNKKVKK